MKVYLAFILSLIASPALAETAIHAQVVAAGNYEHNLDCADRSGAGLYSDCQSTWTTPATLLRTDVIHFHTRAAGAGGCPYFGGGGGGGRVDFDLTDLPPGTVFRFQVGGVLDG